MTSSTAPLRVAFVAGTLVQHGAEKQLVYMAEALRQADVEVRVYTLGSDEYYERRLQDGGIPLERIGTPPGKLRRLRRLVGACREFRPHVVQSGHFYTNLYVTAAARSSAAAALGAIRSDTYYDVASMGAMGKPSLWLPPSLLTNSFAAKANAERHGVPSARLHVLANVIDPAELADARSTVGRESSAPVVALAGRLVPAKRIDRFLQALARARVEVPDLRGLVVGDGPLRADLLALAQRLGLTPPVLEFREATSDLRALLRRVSILALTSQHEGFPNVILEAMMAGVPVVTTPAGDADRVVIDGVTGYVVPFEGIELLANRIVRLARSVDLQVTLGRNGAARACECYSTAGLADRLLAIHGAIAELQGRGELVAVIRRHLAAGSLR
jgi:glycosyltransferase involved in cell wall biosynthesis